MYFPTGKRKLLTLVLGALAFSYLGIVICTVGQFCFKGSDLSVTSSLSALPSDVKRTVRHSHDGGQPKSAAEVHVHSTSVRQHFRSNSGSDDESTVIESQRESHLFQPWSGVPLARARSPGEPLFNCSSISRMKIRSKIGHGVAKETFVAEIDGARVAIKMVTRRIHLVRKCLEKLRKTTHLGDTVVAITSAQQGGPNSHSHSHSHHHSHGGASSFKMRMEESEEMKREAKECYIKPTAKLMKEVMMSLQLHHRNLISLLGFCVRSEESESTDIAEHGVISVYQLGHRFLLDNLQILPWQVKLRHAIELADLLDYLQNSPLGSLAVPDLTEGNLVMAGDSIKLVDLDDIHSQEPECGVRNGTDDQCPLGTSCSRALCEGHNARANMRTVNRLVFKRLLFPLSFPETVVTAVGHLSAQLDSLTLTARELRKELLEIQRSLKGYALL